MIALEALPRESQTADICLQNIQLGCPLHYVRKDLRTEELCLAAVKRNVLNINYVPDDVLTEEMVKIAAVYITTCRRCSTLLPSKFKTEEFYIYAIDKIEGLVNMRNLLLNIPRKNRAYSICLAAVTKYGMTLIAVPKIHKTDELCLAAVRSNGLALQFVENPTVEMCKYAVRNNRDAIKFVPEEIMVKMGVKKKWA